MKSASSLLLNGISAMTQGREKADERGPDGLRRCPVCGEPLEMRRFIPLLNQEKLLTVLCRCGEAEAARAKELEKIAWDRKRLNELTGFSVLDERTRAATFDRAEETAQNGNALKAARRFVEHWSEMQAEGKGLLFYGPPGTGKTFIAACIANALTAQGVPVVVTSLLRLTATMDGDELSGIIDRLKAVRLLVLDDLGAERSTDFKLEQVFSVIDSRYASKLPLIVTTNLSLADLKGGDVQHRRIFDRVLSMCYPVRMDGESWRRAEVRDNYDGLRELLEGDGSE